MGATPFRALDWVPHEVVTKTKMDQMAANSQWLLDNTPRARYVKSGRLSRNSDTGIVIVGGRTLIPRPKYAYSGVGHVKFGTIFKTGTVPFITTGIMSDQKIRTFCVVNGVGGTDIPDHRGFDIQVMVRDLSSRPAKVKGKTQKDVSDKYMYISWIAMGERP